MSKTTPTPHVAQSSPNGASQPVEPSAALAAATEQPAALSAETRALLEQELAQVRQQIEQLKQAEEMMRLQHARDQGRVSGMRSAEELREAYLCQLLGLPLPRPVQPLVRTERVNGA